MNSISLCMVVKNEEMLLEQCIKSVKTVVDEIVIVDTGSKDRTIDVIKRFGARIIHYKWDGSLGRARNAGIKKATCSWILVLDADERIAKKDLHKLKRLVKDTKTLGYIFPIRNYTKAYNLLQNWHPNDGKYPEEEKFSNRSGWALTKRLSLFQRKKGFYCNEEYSGHICFSGIVKKCKGKVKDCDIAIHHFQFLKGEKFVARKQMRYLKAEIKQIKALSGHLRNYLNVGITLFSLKKDNRAIAYFKKAIELNPKSDEAHLFLGMVYKEKARYKEAISSLKKAIRINPKYADAWTVLGMAYDAQGNLVEAERALKRAITIHPYHPLAHNSLGIVYQNQGRFQKAEEEYKKAIQIHPQHPDAYYNLASLYQTQGRDKEAKDKYRIILEINPQNKQVHPGIKKFIKK